MSNESSSGSFLNPPPKKKKLHWVQRGELAPWMLAYARWLAEHPEAMLVMPGCRVRRKAPTTTERGVAASQCARRVIDPTIINHLEQRPDFIAYFTKIREDAHFMAKEAMRGQLAKAIDYRAEGLEMAYQAKDHTELRLYSQHAVELAFPKRVEAGQIAPRVTINIGSGEAKALLAKVFSGEEQVQDVEFEVIPPKQLEPSEEEDR